MKPNNLKKGVPIAISLQEKGAHLRAEFLKTQIENTYKTRKDLAILEIGCGYGAYIPLLANYAKILVEMDIDEQYLNITKSKYEKYYPNVKFIVGDAHKLPFEDNTFDVVILIEVFKHLENPKQVLSEISRVLKPNGTLIFTVPNKYFPFYIHAIIVNRKIGSPVGFPLLNYLPRSIRKKIGSAECYSKKEIATLLSLYNLYITDYRYIPATFDRYKKSPFIVLLKKLLESASNTIPEIFSPITIYCAKKGGKQDDN